MINSPNKLTNLQIVWKNKIYYGFMVPFLSVFTVFTIVPVLIAIFFSFTQFNILEPPQWIGFLNYKKLFLNDEIFLKSVKNTLVFAVITGPISYFMSLLLAWTISEFTPKLRAFLTLLFYTPSLANVYFVWLLIFSSDSYGYLNSLLIKIGIISDPILWLTDEKYMMPVIVFVVLWSSLGAGFLSFVAGFQNMDKSLCEAGAVDGIKNRWQELWFITLPYMRPQLLFGAVMSITTSFSIGPTITALANFPSTNYAVHTIMNHLEDYGSIRFEMGYACAISTVLFIVMIFSNRFVRRLLTGVGK